LRSDFSSGWSWPTSPATDTAASTSTRGTVATAGAALDTMTIATITRTRAMSQMADDARASAS
jgi:hypothetical protein